MRPGIGRGLQHRRGNPGLEGAPAEEAGAPGVAVNAHIGAVLGPVVGRARGRALQLGGVGASGIAHLGQGNGDHVRHRVAGVQMPVDVPALFRQGRHRLAAAVLALNRQAGSVIIPVCDGFAGGLPNRQGNLRRTLPGKRSGRQPVARAGKRGYGKGPGPLRPQGQADLIVCFTVLVQPEDAVGQALMDQLRGDLQGDAGPPAIIIGVAAHRGRGPQPLAAGKGVLRNLRQAARQDDALKAGIHKSPGADAHEAFRQLRLPQRLIPVKGLLLNFKEPRRKHKALCPDKA